MNQYGVLPRYFYYFFLEIFPAGLGQALVRKPWAYLVLVTLLGGVLGVPLAAEVQANPPQNEVLEVTQVAPAVSSLLEDGIYFYGEAPTPGELGHSYMVFEAQGQQVVGAVYMPSSSFDCFQGEITAAALNLEITNSYTQEIYRYAIATVPSEPVASTAGGVLTPFVLSGMYNLGEIQAADLALLQTCKTDLQGETGLEI
ncbi:MAG: hypothetical protein O3A14_14425 [Cyanobacteria bacterium]|nr:hypothetical protein [Cyanobacteriota bacterium]